MAKSFKMKNDIYIDSSAISHVVSGNHKSLKELLLPVNPYVILSGEDLNNYFNNGFYYIVSATNSPCSYAIMLVVTIAGDTVQIIIQISSNNIYIRSHYGTTWSSWKSL